MARAKRTDRAAARRRYRATLTESPETELDDELPPDDQLAAPSRRAAASAPPGGAAQPRPSLASAFRSSFRPLDLRSDLQALPKLVRHPAFLVSVILAGLSVALIPLAGLNALTLTFYSYFSYTAPLGTAFVAGFFAPRASYLIGILAAFASLGFQALAFSGQGNFGGFLELVPDPTTGAPFVSRDAAASWILAQALFTGVPMSAFFASAAAWYRRFLNRASPNRQRQAAAASGRRPDGKVPKRNEQRPILARRR